MPTNCKCPKCKRSGMMQLEKDSSHLPFIHCYACGSVYYRHIIERKLGLNNVTPIKPHKKRVLTVTRVRKILHHKIAFTLSFLSSELKLDRRTLQNTLNSMIKNGEIIRDSSDKYRTKSLLKIA